MEMTCVFGTELGDNVAFPLGLLPVKIWIIPVSHLRPLKIATTHKLVNLSGPRSMWYVKVEKMAEPRQPAAVA